MTLFEFALILGWVLLPWLSIAIAVLVFLQRRVVGVARGRTAVACVLLVSVSAIFAFALVDLGPIWLGPYLGLRDAPFMWAPFAVVAVALAFPLAVWFARSGRRSKV